jgi:hypothetical protein
MWSDREDHDMELIARIAEARASIARGEGRIVTQKSMLVVAKEAKHRLRSRLATEQRATGSRDGPCTQLKFFLDPP